MGSSSSKSDKLSGFTSFESSLKSKESLSNQTQSEKSGTNEPITSLPETSNSNKTSSNNKSHKSKSDRTKPSNNSKSNTSKTSNTNTNNSKTSNTRNGENEDEEEESEEEESGTDTNRTGTSQNGTTETETSKTNTTETETESKKKSSETESMTSSEIKYNKEFLGYIEDFNFNIDIIKTGKEKLTIKLVERGGKDKFEGEFTYKQLIKIDKVFSVFENIDEIIDNLKLIIEEEKIFLYLDMNYEFYFEFFIEINENKRRIRLLLEPKSENSKKRMAQRIVDQNKIIEKLQKKQEKMQKDYDFLYNTIKHNYSITRPNLNQIYYIAQKPKNLSIDSKIFLKEEEITFIKQNIKDRLYKNSQQNLTLQLIYRATRDGDTAEKFHKFCDGICPLIVLIKTSKDVCFGGFTEAYFESVNEFKGKKDDNAFIFSLDLLKCFSIERGQSAILCYKDYGPIFYGNKYSNIFLSNHFFKIQGNVAKKGDRFKTEEDFQINLGEQYFLTRQIEVFQVKLCSN